jgi:formylglycine-generating enzyme required for sulfatase activity/dienelactone hydrolase
VAYAIVGWLLVQVADTFFPALQLPEWTVTFVAGLVILGFPLALILSWAYELTPEGVKMSDEIEIAEGAKPIKGQKLYYIFAGLLAGAVIGSGSVWLLIQDNEAQRVREELIPEIARLIEENDHPAAFALAEEAQEYIQGDPALEALLEEASADTSVATTPPGGDVYVRTYASPEEEWRYIGRTSIDAVRLPRALLRWRIEMEGFETVERMHHPQWGPLQVSLAPEGSVPVEMVEIPAGDLRLTLSGYDYQIRTPAPAYLIDRYEVTNREFKEFVDSGAYSDESYWQHEFIEEGETIPWDEAVARFRDRTGRPGPSTWEGGTYPADEADYPVSGVSWYEAAAYAAYKGKQLPTVYHWLGAAGVFDAGDIVALGNFDAPGPSGVGTSEAMSPYGSFDMAGNVKEWVWNESDDRRYSLGGAWEEPGYVFTYPDVRPPMDRSPLIGFRCVDYLEENSLDPSLFAEISLADRNFDPYEPVSDETFQAYLSQYDYDNSPLDAEVDPIVEESEFWRRERVTFNTAYGGESMDAYIYLPLSVDPPFQTAIIFPSTTATLVDSFDEDEGRMLGAFDFVVQSGRAVVYPVVKSTYYRRDGLQSTLPETTRSFSEHVIQWTNDFRRTIDYLETRDDIDVDALAYYGVSWGGRMGGIIPAVESRLKAAVLYAGGLALTTARPEASQTSFAPHITVPVLMLNGSHDFIFPVETAQRPLFELIGTPPSDRRHVVFEGAGHANFPRNRTIDEILGWLDRYLGRVN